MAPWKYWSKPLEWPYNFPTAKLMPLINKSWPRGYGHRVKAAKVNNNTYFSFVVHALGYTYKMYNALHNKIWFTGTVQPSHVPKK